MSRSDIRSQQITSCLTVFSGQGHVIEHTDWYRFASRVHEFQARMHLLMYYERYDVVPDIPRTAITHMT